jgi:mannose-6-phosphate isomerase-like protein (cupin superfamily)
MIVRNIDDPEVLATTYRAHGGGTARMVMTSHFLEGIEFLAHALLPPGNVLEEHVDPVEEIYYILTGGGLMKVGDEEREVKEGDAIWIPAGAPHRLKNSLDVTTAIMVVAAYPRRW